MAALKEVRQRIKAVRGIGQVTKAMKLVASVKLRRVQDRVLQTRPYTDTLYEIAGKLAQAPAGAEPLHPLLVEGPPGPEALIVIGSDRGLCGGFNTGLFRFVLGQIRGTQPKLILIGTKPIEFWGRQKFEILKRYDRLPFPQAWDHTNRIAEETVTLYSLLRLSRIRIAYQRFVSPGIAKPVIIPWLPFTAGEGKPAGGQLKCEPGVPEVLDLVLPRALTAQLHRAILESQASEQGARMVAMDSATTSAGDLAGDLTLLANKLRQTGITKELLEITSGAEAMNS